MIKVKYTGLVYGEGGNDGAFLKRLISLDKFKYHTSNWIFSADNAHGVSTEAVLEKCQKRIFGFAYDLILCFIDIDDLKHRFPKVWKEKKKRLEEKNSNLVIVWQIDNAEDEYEKVLGKQNKGKSQINKMAREEVEKFINSSFWKRILKIIKEKESNIFEQRKKLEKETND